jgi:nucleoside 2-deoxyribosyltransferase
MTPPSPETPNRRWPDVSSPLLYLAGPLFSKAERRFNLQLTEKLEALGLRVFLPQRDGVEREVSPYDAMTPEQRRHAMFRLDRRQILDCNVFLFVLDGRVPDEGACVELGIAYCQKYLQDSGKLLIGLHTDTRATRWTTSLTMKRRCYGYYPETSHRYDPQGRDSTNGCKLTVTAIRMSSTPNKDENLATSEYLVHAAASPGADLMALPELWSCHALKAPLVRKTT